ncbi:MAG: ABC transporter permease subunit [Oscillospiraceae bacterium]|nr:ABC transporter permease subunit [Oscillospiraceae bacterium]
MNNYQLKKRLRKSGLGAKASRRIGNTAVYIVLILITVIWLFPLFGLVLESFRVEATSQQSYLWPKKFGWDNYVRLFTKTDFPIWFKNTAIMGIATAVLQTFFVLCMSYVLSRLRFKGRKGLMNIMLILGMFPGFLTMILIYKVFSDLGLTMQNAPIGLIIVYCASSGMGYYVSKGFFDTIPKSLDEAARVDGATRWQVFYKVIMPLSKPIIIYTVLMGFMNPWGDFMMASYIIHENSAGMNVAVGVYEWLSKTMVNSNYTMFCAAGVVVAVPVTAVFLMLQKYYVEGVTGGAVKG